jgi:hypothetical protein
MKLFMVPCAAASWPVARLAGACWSALQRRLYSHKFAHGSLVSFALEQLSVIGGDLFLANPHRILVTGPSKLRAAGRTIEP